MLLIRMIIIIQMIKIQICKSFKKQRNMACCLKNKAFFCCLHENFVLQSSLLKNLKEIESFVSISLTSNHTFHRSSSSPVSRSPGRNQLWPDSQQSPIPYPSRRPPRIHQHQQSEAIQRRPQCPHCFHQLQRRVHYLSRQ